MLYFKNRTFKYTLAEMRLIPSKKQWSNWTLPSRLTFLGVCVSIAAVVLTLVIFVLQSRSGATKELQESATIDRKLKQAEVIDSLKANQDILIRIESKLTQLSLRGEQIYLDIGELQILDNLFYRAIKVTSRNSKISVNNFVLRIESDSHFENKVNGPRPVGGGPIFYYKPRINANICEAKIHELKPGQTILLGLYSMDAWSILTINVYRDSS